MAIVFTRQVRLAPGPSVDLDRRHLAAIGRRQRPEPWSQAAVPEVLAYCQPVAVPQVG